MVGGAWVEAGRANPFSGQLGGTHLPRASSLLALLASMPSACTCCHSRPLGDTSLGACLHASSPTLSPTVVIAPS